MHDAMHRAVHRAMHRAMHCSRALGVNLLLLNLQVGELPSVVLTLALFNEKAVLPASSTGKTSRLGRMRRPKRKPASGRSVSEEALREHRLGNVVRLLPEAWSSSPREVRNGWKRLLEAAEEEAHCKGEAALLRGNLRRLSTMAARLNLEWGPQLTRIPADAYPPFLKGEVPHLIERPLLQPYPHRSAALST